MAATCYVKFGAYFFTKMTNVNILHRSGFEVEVGGVYASEYYTSEWLRHAVRGKNCALCGVYRGLSALRLGSATLHSTKHAFSK